MVDTSRVDGAIQRSQEHLLGLQDPAGFWVGELEADSTITAEYLLLRHVLGTVDPDLERKALRYLRARQGTDGSWNLYEAGTGDLSATIKAYFAMKMAGVPATDPALTRAREWILARGGPTQANVFTKITLALFGQYPWGGVPAMPVEIMLLPRSSYFNVWEISYWSRTVLIPLLIVMDRRPVHPVPRDRGVDELWAHHLHLDDPAYARRAFVSWKNFFIGVDGFLKTWEAFGPRPWRARAIRAAHDWLVPRMAVPGGLGGIYPAMVNGVMALRLLGYPDDHALIAGQLKEIEALGIEEPHRFHVQPCVSPVWDTGLAVNALLASGLPAGHPALVRAADWLLDRQVLEPGDWQIKRPGLEPGGWAFQFDNPFYPDLDDTAVVAMGLDQIDHPDAARRRAAIERGVRWLRGMQGKDGGLGVVRHGPDAAPVQQHPVRGPRGAAGSRHRGSHRAMHRVLRAARYLAGRSRDPARDRLPAPYPDAGGRLARALGRELPLRNLVGAPGARGGRDRGRRPHGRTRGAMARRRPEPGRGLGRDVRLLRRRSTEGPRGLSGPSQTAWALLGLMAAGQATTPVVDRGIEFLLRAQRTDGGWGDTLWNGTGFPRVFYLQYHLYAHYFPLWALGAWRGLTR